MELTPMFKQYFAIKEQYKDCIVFYRLGDFYEIFSDDAIKVAPILSLNLTQRAGIVMCGAPYHTSEAYISKLINAGFKVAVCEQMADAVPGGKMVPRDVVQVITAGTVTQEGVLDKNKNNYIMSFVKNENSIAICYCDITTGEFNLSLINQNLESQFNDCLSRVLPTEIISNQEGKVYFSSLPISRVGTMPQVSQYFDWAFKIDRAKLNLQKQFGENFENVFEVKSKELIIAGGSLIEYLNETQKRFMSNINKIKLVKNQDFLILDANTRRNLELTESARERKKHGSLLWLLDKTKTPMGARLLKKRFDEPLTKQNEINDRLDMVEELFKKMLLRDSLSEELKYVNDIERTAGKIAYMNVMPKDLLSLKNSLVHIPSFKNILSQTKNFQNLNNEISGFEDLTSLLSRAIHSDAPSLLKDGGYIKSGFHAELDYLRDIANGGNKWRDEFQEKERERTGIQSLKVEYNRILGYYIVVNKKDTNKTPLNYERKQTISNNERYVTEETMEKSEEVFTAKDKAIKLEAKIFSALKEALLDFVMPLQKTSNAIAQIDCALSLAVCSAKYNFVRPKINNKIKHLKIVEGRHPVVESFLKNSNFISNDTLLDECENRMMIITGPNMAGKSTYMRQVAIITFMAHIGCFVPAGEAEISICDRIFTRVGASDDLAFGQSTFMVEMSEVANILANATDRSLIILDEIGRGTSTFDGLSIAWATVEYICNNFNAKTLFATHYHELCELENFSKGVKNFKVTVKELDNSIVFLHKILRGGANKSFGIEVAQLAQVPQKVIERAKEISQNLEKLNQKLDNSVFKESDLKRNNDIKISNEVLGIIKDININQISPMTAFDILVDLKKKCEVKDD